MLILNLKGFPWLNPYPISLSYLLLVTKLLYINFMKIKVLLNYCQLKKDLQKGANPDYLIIF